MDELDLAGRAGPWSAAHWKVALFGWLAFSVAALVVGNLVGHVQMKDSQAAASELAPAVSETFGGRGLQARLP
jgi:hypothetical protein